ncbi:MAG: pyridoxamine 5'-phosphate oxidase family protein [Oscillospiraceae bacterium]|nr:pyridoxamine 5'-phosphate oxidase family protein [Oscillospiraceae bacterium]
MFRELERKQKQISQEECIAILQAEKRGVLSVHGTEGYPYGMPMNHYYHPEDGCLYFHCGRQNSHRMDAIRADDRVSFCTFDEGWCAEGAWALHIRSVIVFGRMEVIDDRARIEEISAHLSRKFTQDENYIRREIEAFAHETLLLRLIPDHISGKQVTES